METVADDWYRILFMLSALAAMAGTLAEMQTFDQMVLAGRLVALSWVKRVAALVMALAFLWLIYEHPGGIVPVPVLALLLAFDAWMGIKLLIRFELIKDGYFARRRIHEAAQGARRFMQRPRNM